MNTQANEFVNRSREILRGAQALISDPAHFCRNRLAENCSCEEVDVYAPDACRWCALGAISKVAGSHEAGYAARDLLRQECVKLYGTTYVSSVSDGENGHAKILAAFALAVGAH